MNNKHLKFLAVLIFIILYSITGCVSYVKPVDQNMCATKFSFIEDGKTTKMDVLQNLDIADLRYKDKNERIWIYRFRFSEKQILHDLVLVFDENGFLKKHSLVILW